MRKVSYLMILSTLLLPACGSKLPSIKPFKMDVQQGNVVNSKMLLQLRPGMTKSQVRYIMGTPLVVDSFHDNRWYYNYAMRKQGQEVEKRSVILDFEKEALLRVRGDVVPEGEVAAKEESVSQPISVAKAPAPTEKTWWQKLKFWDGNKAAQATAPTTPTATEAVAAVAVEEKPAAPELKVTPELVVESASKESASPEVVASAPVVAEAVESVAETKAVESVPETKANKPAEKSWWERFKFWGKDKSAPAVVAATAVDEKPAVPELKATPEPVVEVAPKEVVSSEAITVSPVGAESNTSEASVVTSASVVSPVKETLTDVKEEIAAAVAGWAEAWRSKDLKAYLSKYANDFKPDGLPNKKAWEAQRKQRLSSKQGTISLDISDVQVQQNSNKVAVKFTQKYASKVYSDQVTKQLDLRLDPATKKWLIVRETASAPIK